PDGDGDALDASPLLAADWGHRRVHGAEFWLPGVPTSGDDSAPVPKDHASPLRVVLDRHVFVRWFAVGLVREAPRLREQRAKASVLILGARFEHVAERASLALRVPADIGEGLAAIECAQHVGVATFESRAKDPRARRLQPRRLGAEAVDFGR